MLTKPLKMRILIVFFVLVFTVSFNELSAREEAGDMNQLYLDAQFTKIVEHLGKKEYQQLTLEEKLLFIESLARTAEGVQAEEKLKPLLADRSSDPEVLAVAAAVYISSGKLDSAQKYIDRALDLKPNFPKAIISRVFLLLYYREFAEARRWYEKLSALDSKIVGSELVFLVGIDVYRACQDPQKLSELYKTHGPQVKKTSESYYESLKANARMYKRAGQNRLFQVETGTDSVVVPFVIGEDALRLNTISITIKGKTFKVLLDTGNATGWLVHSRELNELLKPRTGGRTVTRIGTESGMLDGNRQYYRTVDFNVFKIHHVNGIYVPKPHPGFPDANLNPSFIRDRVVVIDFVKKQMVLQSKGEFEKGLSSLSVEGLSRLDWYGYKFSSVPVEVKGKRGLAMMETGAEDIALKLDFVQGLGLQLIPKVKFLANGQVFNYHHMEVGVLLGNFLFLRKAAEVWPLNRFYNRLTGVSPDVVIGPGAFMGRYMVVFDPFDRKIIILKQKI